jgi:hypothetical protein
MCWYCQRDSLSRNKRLKARLAPDPGPLDRRPFADQSRAALDLARQFFPNWKAP